MKFIQVFFVLSFFCLFIAGCSSAEETSSSNEDAKLTIYTSVYPIQYATEQIAGNTATVNTVFPPGTDAHTYEPASQDIIEIAESDAFIYVGSTMESFSDSIAEALGLHEVKLIELAQYEKLFQSGNSGKDISEEEGETEYVFIEGLSDHYHTGDSINLTATIDEDTDYDHLHWFTRHPDEKDWVVVDGYTANNFEGEAEVDGQQIKAVFYGEDHEVVAESDPVTVEIDDHEGEHHHGEENHEHEEEHHHGENGHNDGHTNEGEENNYAGIEGVSGHYHTGDSINLTATIDEDTDYDHLHWFTRHPDEKDWVVVDGYTANNFEGEAEVDGQQIKAVFYGEDHEVVAESDPVTIDIDDHDGDQDPHIWTDPIRMIQAAEIIKDQLIEINPTEEELYNENFNVLKEKLTEMDTRFTEVLSTKENKSIIVSHAAFGYWEERYGIHQIPISGLSSTDEPSQKKLTEVINQSKEHDLDYVLFEQNSSNRLAEIIQNEIGATPLTLHNLEVLTQNDIDNGEDYISLMEHNLEVLDEATE